MENPEDTAWVFDSLVGFLHGPVWNAPLQTFIEEKSLIFEPTDNGQIPDREEYLAIHDEYKNLVDLMLGSYMEDIGITPEQFEMACQMSKDNIGGLPLHFHQRLFEQIWAANDYRVFTKMMTQRNVELQLQALELIERRNGMTPNSYQSIGDNDDIDDQDADVMEEVKKLSLEDPQFVQDSEHETIIPVENIQQERDSLKTALDNFQKHMLAKEVDNEDITASATRENDNFSIVKDEAEKNIVPSKPLKEDIEQRQQYLKQQRDKLLALKKQIREKQLNDSTENETETSVRPKSAKTAQMVLIGGLTEKTAIPDSSLQLRKALAERLRSEVVEKL